MRGQGQQGWYLHMAQTLPASAMRALVIHLVPPLTRQSPSKAKKGDLCPSAQLQVHAETSPM